MEKAFAGEADLKSLKYLGLSFFLYWLASSLFNIFFPVYLLEIGLSLHQILFVLLLTFLVVGLLPLALLTFFTRNFESLMVVGILLTLAFYATLLFVKDPLLLGLLNGLYIAVFWPSFNLLLFRLTSLEIRATAISVILVFVPTVCGVLGPSIGGFVIERFGYAVLLLSAMAMFAASAAASVGIRMQPLEQGFSLPNPKLFSVFAFTFVVYGLVEHFWLAYPLFLYRLAEGVFFMGILASALSLISSIVAIGVGRLSDVTARRVEFCVAGTFAYSAYLFLLALVEEPLQLIPAAVVWGVCQSLASPSTALLADSFDKRYYPTITVLMEFFLMLGRLGNLALMYVFIATEQFANYFLALSALALLLVPAYVVLRAKYGLK